MQVEYKDGHLIIKVPYNEEETYPKSASGKSNMVATSGGFQAVANGPSRLKFSLNVIESVPKAGK